jgi:hypothetical protein
MLAILAENYLSLKLTKNHVLSLQVIEGFAPGQTGQISSFDQHNTDERIRRVDS